MPIFNNINGVYRKVSKPYCNVNGVQHQVKKAFCNVNGVWREAYSGAVEWTYDIEKGGIGVRYAGNTDYTVEVGTSHSNSETYCAVTYIFAEPLILPASSTLLMDCDVFTRYCYFHIYFDEKRVFYGTGAHGAATHKNFTYTLPSTIKLSKLRAYTDVKSNSDGGGRAGMDIVINPLNGDSFLLDNTGTSEK